MKIYIKKYSLTGFLLPLKLFSMEQSNIEPYMEALIKHFHTFPQEKKKNINYYDFRHCSVNVNLMLYNREEGHYSDENNNVELCNQFGSKLHQQPQSIVPKITGSRKEQHIDGEEGEKALVDAYNEMTQSTQKFIKKNHYQRILELAVYNPFVDSKESTLFTRTQEACTRYNISNQILEQTVLDENGNTIIHIAARHGQEDLFPWFMKKGIAMNVKNKHGKNPMQLFRIYLKKNNTYYY